MIDEVDDLLTLTGLRLIWESETVLTQPPLTTPFRIGDVDGRQPRAARAARRDRQLVRPPAGAPARRGPRGLGDGLELRRSTTATSARSTELLRIHPDEHPVSIQLFGHDPEVMRSAAAIAAEAGADLIDINMGCPVRKVRKTGAGAALLRRPELALALARAAAEGSGRPVTVKLRSGLEPGDRSGVDLAVRLVEEARRRGDRPAPAKRRGPAHGRAPTTGSSASSSSGSTARDAGDRLRRPRDGAGRARRAYRESGADAVMIAARRARQPVDLRRS